MHAHLKSYLKPFLKPSGSRAGALRASALGALGLVGALASGVAVAQGPQLIDLDQPFEGLLQADFAFDGETFFLSQARHNAVGHGDLDGDGQADLVIGAGGRIESAAPSITIDGEVFVQFGPLAVCGEADISRPEGVDLTITGADFQDGMGWAVLVADWNGDGQDDLLVAAPKADGPANARPDVGAVYGFLGPFAPGILDVADADLTVHGSSAGEPIAADMAVGDLNDDGAPDLLIGAPGLASDPAATGKVHAIFGPIALGTRDLLAAPADLVVTGVEHRDQMGTALVAEDLNGDGRDDLFVGARGSTWSPSGVFRGEVFGYFGPLGAGQIDRGQADVMYHGAGNNGAFGLGLEAADLDQDGVLDLVVAAGNLTNPEVGNWTGGAAVWFGPIASNPYPGTSVLSADYLAYMSEVGQLHDLTVGDVSGDGKADLILAGPTKSPDGRNVAGDVEVIYGPFAPGVRNATLEPADLRIWGKSAAGQLGRGAAVADLTGDGVSELVLTASFVQYAYSAGQVYLFDGPHGFPVAADAAPACTADPTLTLAGSADSADPVDLVSAVANGSTVGTVCSNCGLDPVFSFEFPLQACDNVLRFEAVDAAGQRGAVTRKTRRDGDAPVYGPGCDDIEVEVAPGVTGTHVAYGLDAEDGCDGALPSTCDVPSGSFFGLGVTEVSCTSTDTCGNQATCDFRVIVETETAGHTECREDDFSAAPSALWTLDTIGDAGLASASAVAGELHLSGTGSSLFHLPADDTVFLNQEVDGDFFVEVEITGLPVDQGGTYRKGGLMVRAGNDPSAWRVMAQLAPEFNGSDPDKPALIFGYRGPGGAEALASSIADPALPFKVGFARRGDDFTVYYAPSGQGWTTPLGGAGGTITLPGIGDTVLAGMNVSSYNAAQPMTMSFDDFSVCVPNDVDSPPVVVGCDPAKPVDVVYLLDLSGSMVRPFDGATKLEAAQQAITRLNDTFKTLGDGSRGALMTYSLGIGQTQTTNLVSGFTSDFEALDTAAGGIDGGAVQASDASPTASAVDAVTDLLQSFGDPTHRPVLIWLTDNLPNVDLELYGAAYYQEAEVRALSIGDGMGGFLPRTEVAQLGNENLPGGAPPVRFRDGKVLADAMWRIESLSQAFPELRILSAVPRDDGSTTPPISEELLDYAAYHAGGGVFGGFDAAALVAAMSDLLETVFCDSAGNGSVEGTVWRDLDADGERASGVEPGVGGVTVELLAGASVLATATTGSAGVYSFVAVPPGTYEIRVSNLPAELVTPTFDPDGVGTADRFTFTLGSFDALQGDFGYDAEVPSVDPLTGCETDDFEDGALDGAWQATFLGDASSGSLDESAGTLKMSSNGSSLFTTDNAHFLYRHVNGDFRLEIDVESVPVDQGGSFRKAGLMVRDGFSPTAPRLMVQYGPDWPGVGGPALQFSYRATEGGPESSTTWGLVSGAGLSLPVRLAVQRVGNAFSVFYSTNGGATWLQPSGPTTVSLGWSGVLQVGLDAVSYDSALEMTVEMDDFSLCEP